MSKELTIPLRYPNDRFNGFVQLTDGNGNLYVADFIRSYDCGNDAGNAMKYSGAFMILKKRCEYSK